MWSFGHHTITKHISPDLKLNKQTNNWNIIWSFISWFYLILSVVSSKSGTPITYIWHVLGRACARLYKIGVLRRHSGDSQSMQEICYLANVDGTSWRGTKYAHLFIPFWFVFPGHENVYLFCYVGSSVLVLRDLIGFFFFRI